MQTPEEQAEEILILEGFAEPEELEPEIAELLRKQHERILKELCGDESITLDCIWDLPEQ